MTFSSHFLTIEMKIAQNSTTGCKDVFSTLTVISLETNFILRISLQVSYLSLIWPNMKHWTCLEYIYIPASMALLDYPHTTDEPKTGATYNFKNEKKIIIWFSLSKITYTQSCQIFKNGQKWLPIGLFFRQILMGHWNECVFKI